MEPPAKRARGGYKQVAAQYEDAAHAGGSSSSTAGRQGKPDSSSKPELSPLAMWLLDQWSWGNMSVVITNISCSCVCVGLAGFFLKYLLNIVLGKQLNSLVFKRKLAGTRPSERSSRCQAIRNSSSRYC